jgi:Anti-sigma-K factor rskA
MPHVDPDVLALLALGEPVASDPEERHIADCAVCTSALEELRATAAVGRASRTAEPLLTPPARVWEGIAAQLGLPDDVRPRTVGEPSVGAPAERQPELGEPGSSTPPPPPVSLSDRRHRRRLAAGIAFAAAAAVAVVALGITALQSAMRPPEPTVLAEATLEAFPDWPDASGAAVLEELPDGTRQVEVTLDAAVGDDGFREVWLIRDDASDLVSLGVLEGSEGTFAVPADVDVEQFSLVDVSEEPRDGDPAHSGDSIVRGPLS